MERGKERVIVGDDGDVGNEDLGDNDDLELDFHLGMPGSGVGGGMRRDLCDGEVRRDGCGQEELLFSGCQHRYLQFVGFGDEVGDGSGPSKLLLDLMDTEDYDGDLQNKRPKFDSSSFAESHTSSADSRNVTTGCSFNDFRNSCFPSFPSDNNNIDAAGPSNGVSEYHRLLPCPSTHRAPRIEHLVVLEGGSVSQYIRKTLDLPLPYVTDLIRFGAVYCALVCPKPPPTATPEQIELYKHFTAPHFLRKRQFIKGKSLLEAQQTFRITHVDEHVEPGTYLRVHVHPKRFPRCYEIDWRSRIIAVTDSYVVLDKPAGTSVGGTSDNIEESCATFATRALGLTKPLLTTHQIDNCSEGCVVLARTKEYCSVFHKKLRDGKVKKLYLALAAAPVPVGIMTHYMRPFRLAPKIMSEDRTEGWLQCQLEILGCKEVPWPSSIIEEKYGIKDCGWPWKSSVYECTINLLTGRTHQIRAQLAAYGAPIVGDSMYMPGALAEISNPGVNPFGKCKKQFSDEDEKRTAAESWIKIHGREPAVAIGLQACQISWDDGEHVYNAGTPWWTS